jgi:hypothetical protein
MQSPEQERTTVSGREARQGEIILTTKPRRAIFIAGLIGIVVLALILAVFGYR